MSGRYAARTVVSSNASRDEIERTLRRYGATAFLYGWTRSDATIAFELADRRILMRLPLPDRREQRFTHTPGKGLRREPAAAEREYEQAVRQRWRALALIIKAKLEAVEAGITTVESEFLGACAAAQRRHCGRMAQPAACGRVRGWGDACAAARPKQREHRWLRGMCAWAVAARRRTRTSWPAGPAGVDYRGVCVGRRGRRRAGMARLSSAVPAPPYPRGSRRTRRR